MSHGSRPSSFARGLAERGPGSRKIELKRRMSIHAAGSGHSSTHRAAQHRPDRRRRLDRCRGGRQCRDRLPGHHVAGASDPGLDRLDHLLSLDRRSAGRPDAAFIAVPNHEAPAVAGALAARGAGGFVCFTSGFSEIGTETGQRLTQELLDNAGALPFFGPNCYGFVNFFDRAAMLPDQVVGEPIERGVALICQSGTIALTLIFNERSVPIGYLFSVGNQTRLAVEDLIEILCDDARVTAFGLYLEGIKDAERFARAADRARAAGKPIAVIKSGRTAAAARTAHSHTGALAGADRYSMPSAARPASRAATPWAVCAKRSSCFIRGGALAGRKVLIMGASGGDMAMTADVARAWISILRPSRRASGGAARAA